VAVRIGFDDNRVLGDKEGGGRAALPIFREIVLRVYRDELVGPAPQFPPAIEEGIEEYLAMQAALETGRDEPPRPAFDDGLIAPAPATPPVMLSDALLHPSR
jgi:membrane carboxypeptidase/penicillin-binding protein